MFVDRRRADRERRAGPRVAAVFAVKNVVGRAVELGQAEDIGPTGITLRRPKHQVFPPETRVRLTFELPGTREVIAVRGVVVSDRFDGPFRRTGVRFDGLDDQQSRLIAGYCERCGNA